MLREKSHSNGGTHPSKVMRCKKNSSTFLTEENKPQGSADDEHYNSPELENRHGINPVFFVLSLDFLSNYLTPLLLHYSYPVRKLSCSQFSTSESPSVTIAAV